MTALGKWKKEDQEFEVIHSYNRSSRPAWTPWDPTSQWINKAKAKHATLWRHFMQAISFRRPQMWDMAYTSLIVDSFSTYSSRYYMTKFWSCDSWEMLNSWIGFLKGSWRWTLNLFKNKVRISVHRKTGGYSGTPPAIFPGFPEAEIALTGCLGSGPRHWIFHSLDSLGAWRAGNRVLSRIALFS